MDKFTSIIKQLPAIFLGLALLMMFSFVVYYAYNLFIANAPQHNRASIFSPTTTIHNDSLLVNPKILTGDQIWEQKPEITKIYHFESPQITKLVLDKEKKIKGKTNDYKTLEEISFLNLYMGKLVIAKNKYAQIVAKDPKNRSAGLALAYIYYYTGNHLQSLEILDNLLADNSEDLKLIKIKQTIVDDQKKKEEEAKKKAPPPKPPEPKKSEPKENKKPQKNKMTDKTPKTK